MSDLNQCTFVGRLGRDVEGRTFPNGDPVANFSIAVSETWKDKNSGQKQERTEWVNIVATGGLAKVCTDYLSKGSQVLIVGKMRTRKYTDQAGVEKYSTEIRADTMQMLGSKQQDGGQRQQGGYGSPARQSDAYSAPAAAPLPRPIPNFDADDFGIPF